MRCHCTAPEQRSGPSALRSLDAGTGIAIVSQQIADRLAAWCQLEIETFRRIYVRVSAGTDAALWTELNARLTAGDSSDPMARLRQLACREALRVQVLGELALSVSKVQHELGLSESLDADAIVAEVMNANIGGRMQALVVPGGLLGREAMQGIQAVDSATAIVYRRNVVIGTAFLAAPDLVMTAGHVVLRDNGIGGIGNDYVKQLIDDLSFSFRGNSGSAPAVIAYPAAKDALVDSSLPWGRPPNLLHVSPEDESTRRLDFALIRLDREVRHVMPLDVASPPKPERDESLLILGFPGGTAMKWHVGSVAAVHTPRLNHLANALPGMSGSCCINVDGVPMALHEGSLTSRTFAIDGAQHVVGVNRAMCLWAVRNAMGSGPADPLRKRANSRALEFHDEAMVRRWAKAGLRFAPSGLAQQWVAIVTATLGVAPDEPGLVDDFHPWFRRDTFEAWVDQNATPGDSKNRLCIVSGNPGTGKSFLASILRMRVPDEVKDAVVISATETTAWSWRDAIEKWGVSLSGPGGFRPDAGVAMHDEAPKAAESVAGYGDRQGVFARPLFVLIDFDGNASFQTGEEPPWLPFMAELLGYPWVRLVIVGAPEFVTSGLTDLMQDRDQGSPVRIRLEHVGADEFREFSRRLLRKGRPSVPSEELAQAAHSLDRLLGAFAAPTMPTVVAVLTAILLRKSLGS
jgi:hypothetical protein